MSFAYLPDVWAIDLHLDRWHQDIKPANILVFSGSGTSTYDVYFKIADLSLCHFKYMDSVNDEVTDFDAFGTRAYGKFHYDFWFWMCQG